MNHGEDLRKFLLINEISPESVALKLNKAKGTIYNWIKKPELTYETIKLLKDNGFDFLNKSSNEMVPFVKDNELNYNEGNIIYVPLIAYGGFLQGYSNKVYLNSLIKFSIPGVHGEHYAFEVDGMSMWNLAAPGDTAIGRLEEQKDFMVKGKTYVLQTTEGILIKLFEGIKGEKATFNSYNSEYKPIDIPLKSIKRVYFVTRILKKI